MNPAISDPILDADALTEAVSLAFGPTLLRMRPTEHGAEIAPHPTELHTCAAEQAWCLCVASHVAGVLARHYAGRLADQFAPPMGRAWRPRRRQR